MESLLSVLPIKARGRQCSRAALLGCCLCTAIQVNGADQRVDSSCPTNRPTTRLGAWVVDEHGAPISNATVSAWPLSYSWQTFTNANTDEAGALELPLFGGFWGLSVTAHAP